MDIMKKIAIYPGSFDPITNGHIDILKRALRMFDEVILLLAIHPTKQYSFSQAERLIMLEAVRQQIDPLRIRVDATQGLTVHYARQHQAIALVRGLRAVPDFTYEHEMYAANQYIDEGVEMLFLMAKNQHEFISSSMIKSMYKHGVDVTALVPKIVLSYLKKLS
jgi:pantetheine-phosphate adenylyltransferase